MYLSIELGIWGDGCNGGDGREALSSAHLDRHIVSAT